MSPLGFKARVVLFTHGGGIHVTSFLILTSGVTPANLLAASMAAEPFFFNYKALVGLEARIYHAADEHSTD